MTRNPEKQWTIIVYLAGDNNLDGAGVADLIEMKKVGSTDQMNVIAQFDRAGAKKATNRYYLRKGGKIEKDVVEDLGETNSGDPNILESFIKWGIEYYPAKHYLVVVWNHGNGWNDDDVYRIARSRLKLNVARRRNTIMRAEGKPLGSVSVRRIRVISGTNFHHALFSTSIKKAVTTRGIAYDDNAQDFLDNLEMKRLLLSIKKKLGRKLDILGMDACLMSMAEVGYQLRDAVNLTVGSEETEPGDGWPYDKILETLAKKPTMTPLELSKMIVKKYLGSYAANAGVTQAACDLTRSKEMAAAVDQLAKKLITNFSNTTLRTQVVEARIQAQSYEVADYIDLYDFCDLLIARCQEVAIKTACQNVMEVIRIGGFVVDSGHKGVSVGHSHGLSIYFPQKELSPTYAKLDFTRKTAWGKFISEYLSSTGRRA
jgi:hypothetical protein